MRRRTACFVTGILLGVVALLAPGAPRAHAAEPAGTEPEPTVAAPAGAAAAAAATGAAPATRPGPARVSVSAPGLTLERGEFIQRFELTVRKGHITALPRLPAPWRYKIANERDSADLQASAEQGSGEFGAAMFRDFVEVELAPGGTVALRVITSLDFERIARRLTFDGDELTLRPVDR